MANNDLNKLIKDFEKYAESNNFLFEKSIPRRYITSLMTKPFVILTGISGTGKTKIAQLFGEFTKPIPYELYKNPINIKDVIKTFKTDKQFQPSHNKEKVKENLGGKNTIPAYFMGEEDNITVSISNSSTKVFFKQENLLYENIWNYYKSESYEHSKHIEDYRDGKINELPDSLSFNYHINIYFVDDGEKKIIFIPIMEGEEKDSLSNYINKRYLILPVRPDWADNRALLGYYNPITEKYQPTELLKLMLMAQEDSKNPYFVILDEMNLAKVEYYFSDFLSSMESDESIPLYDSTLKVNKYSEEKDFNDEPGPFQIKLENKIIDIPPGIKIPSNLYFTGTVNIDETTYMFSPKVLDRANVFEFIDIDLEEYKDNLGEKESNGDLEYPEEAIVQKFVESTLKSKDDIKDTLNSFKEKKDEEFNKLYNELVLIHKILENSSIHFGYRVIDEALCYIFQYLCINNEDDEDNDRKKREINEALDHQIYQKILPKLYGNKKKLREPLFKLLINCLSIEKNIKPIEKDMNESLKNLINNLKKKEKDEKDVITNGSGDVQEDGGEVVSNSPQDSGNTKEENKDKETITNGSGDVQEDGGGAETNSSQDSEKTKQENKEEETITNGSRDLDQKGQETSPAEEIVNLINKISTGRIEEISLDECKPLSAIKICRMLINLENNGFTSFIV